MGPLRGLRFVELAGIGPAPLCAMLLADMGADVLRVDRLESSGLGIAVPPRLNLMNRGRRSVGVDLKHPDGVATVLDLVAEADGLLEGFRPGVAERLGLGPEECWARNPRLVYGRVTGWGQDGPLASAAGHDLNYIALTGVLDAIGGPQGPVPPLNLVGDFGGGAMFLAFGMLCALHEARDSGRGQVVDAAMIDGAAVLSTMFHGLRAIGRWRNPRGGNVVDGGAPFYCAYETKDGRHVSIAPIEAKFWRELLERLGLAAEDLPEQMDEASWPEAKQRLAELFRTRTLEEWCELLEGSDACFAPVLDFEQAPAHPHNRARGTFVEYDGVVQPAPAPRFSRTPPGIQRPPPEPGEHTAEALADWGIAPEEIERRRAAGAIG